MRIPEYDDGYDSAVSFERADEDQPEDFDEEDYDYSDVEGDFNGSYFDEEN